MTHDVAAPTFSVRCLPDGEGGAAPRMEEIKDRVVEYVYEDKEKGADVLSLTVDNYLLDLTDDPAFKKGMLLETSFGYPGRMAPARQMVVTRITGARQLKVVAHDRSILMARKRHTRAFTNMRRSDIVRQVAAENGFADADTVDVEDTPIVYESVHQARSTDAAFLTRLAHLQGFEFYVDWDGFHWHSRRTGQRPARALEYFTAPAVGEVMEWNVENDITARPARTRVQGRDLLNRQDIDVHSDDASDTDRVALAENREIVDPESGDSISATTSRASSEETRTTTAQDAASAQAEARARFRHVQLTAVKMTLTMVGDPEMFAKSVVELRGFGRRLSQRYWVKVAKHTIRGSYTTALNLASDGDGGHARESLLARGLELVAPTPTAARTNTADAPPGADGQAPVDAGPLEPRERVDEETGDSVTTFHDSRGRASGGG